MSRFPDASSYFCKSLGLRGFEFQLYLVISKRVVKHTVPTKSLETTGHFPITFHYNTMFYQI